MNCICKVHLLQASCGVHSARSGGAAVMMNYVSSQVHNGIVSIEGTQRTCNGMPLEFIHAVFHSVNLAHRLQVSTCKAVQEYR